MVFVVFEVFDFLRFLRFLRVLRFLSFLEFLGSLRFLFFKVFEVFEVLMRALCGGFDFSSSAIISRAVILIFASQRRPNLINIRVWGLQTSQTL